MAQIEQLLKYQEEDAKLIKIEQELSNSEERKNYVQIKNFLTKAPEKLDQLENKSVDLTNLLNGLNKKYEEIVETLKDFDHLDELVESGADIAFYKKNAMQIVENLRSLKNEINDLTQAIKAASDEYATLKKKVIVAQKQAPEIQNAYQEYKSSKQGEVSAIKLVLEKIEKDIEPDVFKKYQAKRSERIFPILCEIVGDRCSKCGIELSIAGKEAVSSGKVIECENCQRILYKI